MTSLGLTIQLGIERIECCSYSFGHGSQRTSIPKSFGSGNKIVCLQIGREESVGLVAEAGLEQCRRED